MASYLLKADDETMARWKDAAKKDEAPSFADWLRVAIEEKIARADAPRVVFDPPESVEPTQRPIADEKPQPQVVTWPSGGKEFKGMDPKAKGPPKEKKGRR